MLRKSYRWQRLRIVGSTFSGSVVARMNFTCGGGSSSVLSSALNALFESMCTSSMMYTLKRERAGRNWALLIRSRTLSTPVFDAASISMTSMSSPAGDRRARVALAAGIRCRGVTCLTIQALGQDAGGAGLAGAARAAEQIGVCDAAGGDRLLQRARDVVLPDEFIEVAGAVAAGEDGVSHKRGRFYQARTVGTPSQRAARHVLLRSTFTVSTSARRSPMCAGGGT
jgi:hypothetical protein